MMLFMVLASLILIAVYSISLVLLVNWPKRSRSPDDAMGIGLAYFFVVVLLFVGLILAVVGWFQIHWLIEALFVMVVFPGAVLVPNLIWLGMKTLAKKRQDRGTLIPVEELAARLVNHTHVFSRFEETPVRSWTELRYFAPDGRLVSYEEEQGGKVRRLDVEMAWSVEGGCLVIVGDIHPGNRNQYRLRETPTKQIGYHAHVPRSRLNGMLSRRTIGVRKGRPVEAGSELPAPAEMPG